MRVRGTADPVIRRQNVTPYVDPHDHGPLDSSAPEGPIGLTGFFSERAQCIAALIIDGGTRFALEFDVGGMIPDLVELVDELRRPTSVDTDERERRQGGTIRALPVPVVADEQLDDNVAAIVTTSGSRKQYVTFYVTDRARISINVEAGTCKMQLKARELWALGYERAAALWLARVGYMLTGQWCELATSHDFGWRTTGLEICSDFIGLPLYREDAGRFVGAYKQGDTHKRIDCFGGVGDSAETISIGSRNSDMQVVLYDKDKQLAQEKGGDDSIYRSTHEAHGWDGEAERTRVEYRLRGRGLQIVDRDTGEMWDFRDPATAAGTEALRYLWAYVSQKKRLVDPEGYEHLPVHRCPTQDRWLQVARVADLEHVDLRGLRQARVVQTDTYNERVKRAAAKASHALIQVAALAGQIDATAEQIELDLPLVAAFVRDVGQDTREDLEDYGLRYAATQQFVAVEIRDIGRPMWDDWRRARRGPLVGALLERLQEGKELRA